MNRGVNNQCLFSIIIPLYNCENYIDNCIKSIINQSFQSFEIIVVDDGSSDNSVSIIKSYLNIFTNIKFISQQNSGPYNARLNGVEQAKGEYLLFVDSDDELHKDALRILRDSLKTNDVDIVLFYLSDNPDYSFPKYSYSLKNRKIYSNYSKYRLYQLLVSGNTLNNLANKCVKRSLFLSIGFDRISDFYNAEDLFMVVQLIDKASRVLFIKDILYYYRTNDESTTHTYNKYYYDSLKRTNTLCIQYSKKWKNPVLVLFAHKRASRACVLSIKNLLQSSVDWKDYLAEVSIIIDSSFFKSNHLYVPLKSDRIDFLLFIFALDPKLLTNRLMYSVMKVLF